LRRKVARATRQPWVWKAGANGSLQVHPKP
jgi:hypothetical protein